MAVYICHWPGLASMPGNFSVHYRARQNNYCSRAEYIILQPPVSGRFIYQAKKEFCGDNFPWVTAPIKPGDIAFNAPAGKGNSDSGTRLTRQRIAGASAAAFIPHQKTLFNQLRQVAGCSGAADPCDCFILAVINAILEVTIQHSVDHFYLLMVQRRLVKTLPVMGF